MGARSLAQAARTAAAAAGKDFSSTNTQMQHSRKPTLVPHLLFSFSLLPAAPSCTTGCFCKQELLFPLQIAGRQRSKNPPARCDTGTAMRALHTPQITKVFWHHNIQPKKCSYWKGRRQKPAKTTRNGESTSLREKQMTKSSSIQGSATEESKSSVSRHSLLWVPENTQTLCLVCSSAWKQNPKRTFSDNNFKMFKLISPCLVWF